MAEIKLTEGGERIIEATAKQGAQTASRHTHRLIEQGLLDNGNELTDAGREYAIAHGWLAAPANSEPQADITPADRAAVESMGEVAANVFGEDICDCGHHDAHPIEGLCQNCYTSGKETVHQILMDKSASEIHEDAQTAPVDGGNTAPPTTGESDTLTDAEILALAAHVIRTGETPANRELLASNVEQAAERQQAEIRTLERQLAAAAAALTEIRDIPEYPVQISNQMSAGEIYDTGRNVTLKSVKAIVETALAALQQSGAGDGK